MNTSPFSSRKGRSPAGLVARKPRPSCVDAVVLVYVVFIGIS